MCARLLATLRPTAYCVGYAGVLVLNCTGTLTGFAVYYAKSWSVETIHSVSLCTMHEFMVVLCGDCSIRLYHCLQFLYMADAFYLMPSDISYAGVNWWYLICSGMIIQCHILTSCFHIYTI